MIAMALSCNPAVLIADEPTTALDVTIQAQIIELIGKLKNDFNSAVIMITHDLGVVAEMADEVVVMYAGKVVERADVRTVFGSPHHPYTQGLLRSIRSSRAAIRSPKRSSSTPRSAAARRGIARSRCSGWWASRTPSAARKSIRISSPAACASV